MKTSLITSFVHTNLLFMFSVCNNQEPLEINKNNPINQHSNNWQNNKESSDLKWLLDSAITKGMTIDSVKNLLGEPLEVTSIPNGGYYLCYLKIDQIQKQYYTGGVVFDENNVVLRTHWKGIE